MIPCCVDLGVEASLGIFAILKMLDELENMALHAGQLCHAAIAVRIGAVGRGAGSSGGS